MPHRMGYYPQTLVVEGKMYVNWRRMCKLCLKPCPKIQGVIGNGATYGTRYNCNHWTEEVARQLGYNITVHWNCQCVNRIVH